jgi:hypothetical protein
MAKPIVAKSRAQYYIFELSQQVDGCLWDSTCLLDRRRQMAMLALVLRQATQTGFGKFDNNVCQVLNQLCLSTEESSCPEDNFVAKLSEITMCNSTEIDKN